MMRVRDFMKVFETSALLSGDTDFGLSGEITNLKTAMWFDTNDAETLFEDDQAKLSLIDRGGSGCIGLVAKIDQRLYYFVEFESQFDELVGSSVTQVKLWRDVLVRQFFDDPTAYVFFEVLLRRFGTVMSDELQYADAVLFWKRVCAMAVARKMTVQFADYAENRIETFDPTRSLLVWFSEIEAWGPLTANERHEKRRLIISTRNTPS